MKIDFATLAFGYTVLAGGGTPNWATSLGQGRDYKINENPEIDQLLRGLVYSTVPLSNVSSKIGKGGRLVRGNEENSPILMASLFKKVYINNIEINGEKYIILITKDTSESHRGRLRFKYGPSNTYTENGISYNNEKFWENAKKQLNIAEDACFFVHDISVRNQNELIFNTVFVNNYHKKEYSNTAELHKEWDKLIKEHGGSSDDNYNDNEKENTKGIIDSDNFLLYGVPGCGKSHKVEEEYESKITTEKNKVRVVFHPDYTYSDFVGQLLPVLKEVENAQGVKEEKLQYEFVPGPFTKIIKTAYEEPNQQCLLIIEELNRGNAPAIFGEIFQLLDRNDNGESKYGIYNADIAKYAYGGLPENQGIAINVIANTPIKLPPNLTIVATMNTSDQNVFTMDTAFQRRWQMEHIPNKFDFKTAHVNKHLPNSEISWGVFAQTINKKMHTANLGFGGTEDKSLGVYFATDNDLDDAERFAEKVLKYLWDDAFKLGRKELFNDCSQGLSAVIEAYEDAAKAKIEKQSAEDPLKKVLVPEVYNEMQKKMAEMAAEQAKTAEEKTSEEEAAESAAEDNPAQEPAGEE